jgi:hypothetical protein
MKAGQLCSFRANRTGQKFGELIVIGDIGNHIYKHSNGTSVAPILNLICPVGHIEQRNIVSLRYTGDNTQCKKCRKHV